MSWHPKTFLRGGRRGGRQLRVAPPRQVATPPCSLIIITPTIDVVARKSPRTPNRHSEADRMEHPTREPAYGSIPATNPPNQSPSSTNVRGPNVRPNCAAPGPNRWLNPNGSGDSTPPFIPPSYQNWRMDVELWRPDNVGARPARSISKIGAALSGNSRAWLLKYTRRPSN